VRLGAAYRGRMTRRRAHHEAAGGEGLKARAHGLQADLLPGLGERSGQPVGALWALAQQVEDLEVYVRLSIVGVHSAIMPVWRLREAPTRRKARSKGQKSPSERHLSTPALAPYRALYAGYGAFRVRIAVTNGSLPTFWTGRAPRELLMYGVLRSSRSEHFPTEIGVEAVVEDVGVARECLVVGK
jgi:hypothetical protein